MMKLGFTTTKYTKYAKRDQHDGAVQAGRRAGRAAGSPGLSQPVGASSCWFSACSVALRENSRSFCRAGAARAQPALYFLSAELGFRVFLVFPLERDKFVVASSLIHGVGALFGFGALDLGGHGAVHVLECVGPGLLQVDRLDSWGAVPEGPGGDAVGGALHRREGVGLELPDGHVG